ncbi:acetoacetyl-CoA synthase [Tribonema minus]|uniref:Acetoacetyl-CoA synthase n=1 Tax=Tribonema minus TaxID=303371 RepID=A0A836CAD5_9STRA|nr:acetoacetyl-CoA synthase [Tribonema minus]
MVAFSRRICGGDPDCRQLPPTATQRVPALLQDLSKWEDLHAWSVHSTGPFWSAVADYCGVRWADKGTGRAYIPPPAGSMRGATWFEGSRLNFAENLMPRADDDRAQRTLEAPHAIAEYHFPPTCHEAKRMHLSPPPLRIHSLSLHSSIMPPLPLLHPPPLANQVALCAHGLRKAGVRAGDCVAGVVANSAEALVCMLAATSMGAVWSSCSPDFGVAGVVDRLGQVNPKVSNCVELLVVAPLRIHVVLRSVDGATPESCCSHACRSAPPAADIKVTNATEDWRPSSAARSATSYADFVSAGGPPPPLQFAPLPFDHPVYIMFSSGTTGLPKCMVHGAGGTLLHQKKELMLHCDMHAGDRMLFYTTTGWMMWNWLAAGLSVEGASIVTYDGSPAYPDISALWSAASLHKVTHLGASPKYFGACMAAGLAPIDSLALLTQGLPTQGAQGGSGLANAKDDLSALRVLLSTGSPLLPSHYKWVYSSVKRDVFLASISGGTDIIGCFMLGNPNLPVHAGEIQCAGLGMDVCAYDDGARRGVVGAKGELVCRTPFPSMPTRFLNDPQGLKYRDAYFAQGEDMWRHGDFIEVNERGGVVVHGRSDATLNPGGVRIGTAEIYRQVETLPAIADSLAIGRRTSAGDVDVVLFVKMADGHVLDEDMVKLIKTTIRARLTPRHVPRDVVRVADVPYTRSGKKVEVAVTRAVHGEKVTNVSALVNPECLDEYRQLGVQWGTAAGSKL